MGIYLGAAFAGLYAVAEWWRFWRKDQFHPWFWSFFAVIIIGFAVRKIRASLRESHQYREGRDGERLVAERLDELRDAGFHSLHDVVAGKFNIDHVLIGPTGVFAIETKTLHKRGGKDEKAEFNGAEILIHGKPLPRNPITQARANANWLQTFLRESTSRPFAVTPVVILPGWYVAPRVKMKEVLVLNDHPNGLRAYIVDRPDRLLPEEVALIKTHLSLFIRKPA